MLCRTGELPLVVVRMLSLEQCNFDNAGLGFSLPENIGDLDSAITNLNLGHCKLTGSLLQRSILQLAHCSKRPADREGEV